MSAAFARLWLSAGASNLSDGLHVAALPLLAATLTDDPLAFSGVAVATRLPWLLAPLPAGVLLDRLPRARVVRAALVARVLLVGALAALSAVDALSLPLLYTVAGLLGLAETVGDIGLQTLVPSYVEADALEQANGRLLATEVAANEFAGPPLGGALFAASTALPFLVETVTLTAAACALPAAPAPAAPARWADRPRVREGFALLWHDHRLRGLALLGSTVNACSSAGLAVMALYALELLQLGPAQYGLLLAGGAVGTAVGAMAAPRVVARVGRGRALLAAPLVQVLVHATLAGAPHPLVVGAGLAALGAGGALWNVVAMSYRQRSVSGELLGRVNSAYRLVQWGSMPIGALAGGLLADAAGLRAPWLATALLMTMATPILGIPLARAFSARPSDWGTGS